MLDHLELLRKCSLLSRAAQQKKLKILSPHVEVLQKNATSGSVLLVSTWNARDAEALMAFCTLANIERNKSQKFRVGLTDWFGSIAEIKEAIDYAGPTLQTPFVVMRDLQNRIKWSGEGYDAREWLLKRRKASTR